MWLVPYLTVECPFTGRLCTPISPTTALGMVTEAEMSIWPAVLSTVTTGVTAGRFLSLRLAVTQYWACWRSVAMGVLEGCRPMARAAASSASCRLLRAETTRDTSTPTPAASTSGMATSAKMGAMAPRRSRRKAASLVLIPKPRMSQPSTVAAGRRHARSGGRMPCERKQSAQA